MDLAYDRTGSGEPLVLLHGLGHHRRAWSAVVPMLAAERDVITVDLPGHGDSPAVPPSTAGDFGALADEVEKFLRSIGLEAPHVAGNSLGGLIALELGARGYAASVTALSPASFWNVPERIWIVALFRTASLLGARLPQGVLDRIVHTRLPRAALFGLFFGRPGRHDPAVLVDDLRGLGRQRAAIGEVLKRIKETPVPAAPPAGIPVTIGWGRRDLVLFPNQARRARRAIPTARIVALRRCGHVPMGDDPAHVASVLLDGSRRPRPG
ncbi:MAG: alpha/beta fold hydrolase [Acidimicrobiia bacterium]